MGHDDDVLVDRRELARLGCRYSAAHLWKLCKAGRFPQPVQPNGVGSRLFWRLGDYRRWRDGQWTPSKLATPLATGVTRPGRRPLPTPVEIPPQRAPRRPLPEAVSAPRRRPSPPSTASVAPRRRLPPTST